jgi:hypothetical protein
MTEFHSPAARPVILRTRQAALFMSYSSLLWRMRRHAALLRRKDGSHVWDRIEISDCRTRSCNRYVKHDGDKSRERPDRRRHRWRSYRGSTDRRGVSQSAGLRRSAASSGILRAFLCARARYCGGTGLQIGARASLGRVRLPSPSISRLRLTRETPVKVCDALQQ